MMPSANKQKSKAYSRHAAVSDEQLKLSWPLSTVQDTADGIIKILAQAPTLMLWVLCTFYNFLRGDLFAIDDSDKSTCQTCGLGRTEISGPSPKLDRIAVQSTAAPCAMDRTVWNGSATVRGTGRSSRTRRCRHFARQPCVLAAIRAGGVTSVKSRIGSCFCTAAPFAVAVQHTPNRV